MIQLFAVSGELNVLVLLTSKELVENSNSLKEEVPYGMGLICGSDTQICLPGKPTSLYENLRTVIK